MRITLDATPLLGPRTGIGRYVHHLLAELPGALSRRGIDGEVRATTWTARGAGLSDLPREVRQVGPRVPARALREFWRRTDVPPIEALVGRTDVFHGTNFVSPPTRRALPVLTVHDLTYIDHAPTVSRASLVYRELVPRALRRGALVVTPSRSVADAVQAHYGVPGDRVHATPLGVGDVWFSAAPPSADLRAQRRLPGDYLLFVGSLDPRKNLPALLRAYSALRHGMTDAPHLVLAGPAGRETSLPPQEGVHLTGWLDDVDLRAVVAGCRALVLPSLDEGFGLPALEALACGRPVVATDIPALREVTGGLATFASPTDDDSLADALSRVLSVPDGDAEREVRRAQARTFTWEICADRTLDVYLMR